jgi:predicted permease
MLLLDFVGSAPPEWWAERTAFQPTGRRATRMDNFFQDLRYALRSFRVAPTATLVTALTIALGIGATTTIFSAANALLLRPPAGVSDPDRLVTVHAMSEDGSSFHSFSYLDYRDLAAAKSGLAELAAFSGKPASLSTGGEPRLQLAMLVSANYFHLLGARPAVGRLLLPEDDAGIGGAHVAVISHSEWQRGFAGDSAIVGRRVLLNGEPFTIVGVTEKGFRGHVAALDASIWVPVALNPVLSSNKRLLESRQNTWLELVGRLEGKTRRAAAAAALSDVATRLGRSTGATYDRKIDVRAYSPLPAQMVLPATGFLALLLVLGLLVLLIASANVANVLLARASARAREIAVRLAIGAGRGRLVRQLVTESVALFVVGGAGGTLLAAWATRALSSLHPPVGIPIALDFSLDLRVLLVALGVTLLTGIAFGLAPALQATRPNLIATLKDEPSLARVGRLRLRGAFVAAQVAGTTLLLVTAGLFVRALGRAGGIDLGFDPLPVHALSLEMEVRAAEPNAVRVFAEQLEQRVAQLPGVTAVGTTDMLPLNFSNQQTVVAVPGREERPDVGWFQTDFTSVSPGYFRTMGLALVRGRMFTAADRDGGPAVVIVNETLARKIWGSEDPVGKTLSFGRTSGGTPMTIVGVARIAKYRSLGEDPLPMLYAPYAQQARQSLSLVVRTAPGAPDPARGLREAVHALDPTLPIVQQAPLIQLIGLALLPNRIALGVAALFGGAGLLLAAVGLYGVLSYMVSRRRREIGIRMALGAAAHNVRNLVLRDGLRLVAIGLLVGFASAAAVSRLLRSMLFGVSPLDPVTYAAIALVLGGVALAACLVPVRRALRTEPLEVLRHD